MNFLRSFAKSCLRRVALLDVLRVIHRPEATFEVAEDIIRIVPV